MESSQILDRLVELNEAVKERKPAAREQMLNAAQALVTSLQTPSEFISCVAGAEPARWAFVRMAIDLKIFETLNYVGKKGASAADLAQPADADPALIDRIMRHLTAMNVTAQTPEGLYTSTKLSSELTVPKYRDGIIFCYDVQVKSLYYIPSYFAKIQKYIEPRDPIGGPFQHALETSLHLFPWLAQNPPYGGLFANYMAGYREGKRPWFSPDFYPVQSQLIEGYATSPAAESTNQPLVVDVGGGKGHDLLALQRAFPTLPGRLVLEDQADIIASIDPPLPSNIEVLPHDFFTPQPESCRGARAYFLHSILHDWDDDSCVKILQALKASMKQGYSKILVHDFVVPDRDASWGVTSMDTIMMAVGAAKERTETAFHELFTAAGLVIEKIWVYEAGTEAIIEAMLPTEG